jgi:adenylate cyclase
MNPGRFFAELKRRKVYRVAVAYTVVAWLLIQVATQVFPFFEIPDWAVRLVVLLLLLGFPVALVLAWAFDLTPAGVKRTEPESPAATVRSRRGVVVLACAGAVIAALAGAAVWHWQLRDHPGGASAAAPAAPQEEMRSLAVLPFVNMSGDPANEYFSDGITAEIVSAVAHVPDLRVASRTSAFAYKGRNEDIGEIARNLRVTTVLEGSVQRSGDSIRITAQLVDARTGYHLWSKRFDRQAKDLFAVQDEIAQAIASALELELTSGGKQRGQRAGTENVASHDAYLKALQVVNGPTADDRQQALAFVNEAIALDPKFAAAYALKAEILSSLAFGSPDDAIYDRFIEQGEAAANRAVELDPQLAEAHAALGEMARRRGEDAAAIEYLKRAVKLKPGDATIWQAFGLAVITADAVEALRAFQKARELGNTSLYLPRQISYSLDWLGRLDEAHATITSHHAAHPEFVGGALDLGRFELWVRGRPDRALEFFAKAYQQSPAFIDASVPVSFYPAFVYAISGHIPEAKTWLNRELGTAPDSIAITATRLLIAANTGDRNELAAVAASGPGGRSALTRGSRLVYAADAALLLGDYAAAADLYQQMLDHEGSADGKKTMRKRRSEVKRAFALQKLGRTAEAEELLRAGPETFPSPKRYSFAIWTTQPGNGVFYTDAELYALRGEKEKALQALNATLALPDDGLISFGSLPVPIEDSPLLESLHREPGFVAFRQEVARRRAIMKNRVAAVTNQLGLAED